MAISETICSNRNLARWNTSKVKVLSHNTNQATPRLPGCLSNQQVVISSQDQGCSSLITPVLIRYSGPASPFSSPLDLLDRTIPKPTTLYPPLLPPYSSRHDIRA